MTDLPPITEAPEQPQPGSQYRVGNNTLTWLGDQWQVSIPHPTDDKSE